MVYLIDVKQCQEAANPHNKPTNFGTSPSVGCRFFAPVTVFFTQPRSWFQYFTESRILPQYATQNLFVVTDSFTVLLQFTTNVIVLSES